MLVCLRNVNLSLEQDANCLFNDSVNAGRGVFVDLVQADIVLAITGVTELRHWIEVDQMASSAMELGWCMSSE